MSYSFGGTGLTTAQMKQQASFTDWDFINTWKITNGVTYPELKWPAITFTQYTGPSNETNTDHLLLVVTNAVGTAQTIQFFRNPPAAGTLPSGVNHASPYRWVINASSLTLTSAIIRVPVVDLAGVTDQNKLVWLQRSAVGSGAWTNIGGHINGEYLESDAFTSLSEFAIGSTTGDNPLPVELKHFVLTHSRNGVKLEWVTASETDNLGFIVSRSEEKNGAYRQIASYQSHQALKGQGTTAAETNYQFSDYSASLQPGKTYFYKLEDVNLTGQRNLLEIKEIKLPDAYSLSQNYPNPFNPTTTIQFSLKQDGKTVLEVYNILGQKVATLVNAELKAGAHVYHWNALGYASGVYFYRLASGSFVQNKKMMLLK